MVADGANDVGYSRYNTPSSPYLRRRTLYSFYYRDYEGRGKNERACCVYDYIRSCS